MRTAGHRSCRARDICSPWAPGVSDVRRNHETCKLRPNTPAGRARHRGALATSSTCRPLSSATTEQRCLAISGSVLTCHRAIAASSRLAALIARNQTLDLAVVPRLGTRPRSHASRDLRDHHSPRVLCRLGDCHGRRCCREGDLRRAWHRARSGSRRFTAATSAWSGRRAATCNARAAGRQASIPGARRLYDRPAVPGSVAPRGPRAAGSVGAPIWLLAALSILIGLGSALSVPP